MSDNAWLYVLANPVDYTDPSGHDPWWCDGQYNQDLCTAQWLVANGGRLTSNIVKSIYWQYPDETLGLLQQEFSIRIPAEYHFRFAFSAVWDPGTLGAGIWFAESRLQPGSIFELSQNQCGLLSLENAVQAKHIDYSIYITKLAFARYDFSPDDVAGVMIHEAVHAWQESIARLNLGNLANKSTTDFRSLAWTQLYAKGMERQAMEGTLNANNIGRIHLSRLALSDIGDYWRINSGGPNSPIQIPYSVP